MSMHGELRSMIVQINGTIRTAANQISATANGNTGKLMDAVQGTLDASSKKANDVKNSIESAKKAFEVSLNALEDAQVALMSLAS
jgi:hypothetical protein